jgi:hypothetical protein
MSTPRIAFLILAHQDPAQLERLCGKLGSHAIFVHVDRRAVGFPLDRIAALPGVTVVEHRIAVYWTDFSMVDATLTLLKAAGVEEARFDRYILLSGACYPVRPMAELEAAMTDMTREWIAITPIVPKSHLHSLIARRWRISPLISNAALDAKLRSIWNKAAKIVGRNLESETGLPPYFGNSWWALTSACAAMIVRYLEEHPAVIRSYRTVYAPDEQIFHTVIANSEFAANAMPVEDRGAETNQIMPLHLISASKDRVFGSTDAEFQVAAATEKFFIRKVSSERTSPLLDRINTELLTGAAVSTGIVAR